jgi:hypothetical protein
LFFLQVSADCECIAPTGDLLLAGLAGSLLFDLIENVLVFIRGSADTLGVHRRNRWPSEEPIARVLAAAILRAGVATATVGFLVEVVGAVTTATAAGAVGFALWPAITTFLGYAASHPGPETS